VNSSKSKKENKLLNENKTEGLEVNDEFEDVEGFGHPDAYHK
jgi:hypothetical protein